MDWSNERYVRIYTRDTKTWKLLGWEGQTVLCLLSRKFDRAGILDDVRNGEDVALMIGCGFPLEVANTGLNRLISNSVMEIKENGLFWPKFMEAQEATMTDAQRQRESRQRRREKAALESQKVTGSNDIVTESDNMSRAVTTCHELSQPVTPSLPSVPGRTVLIEKEKKEKAAPSALDSDFLAFWSAYPNKKKKQNAEKAYKKARKTASAELILTAVLRQKNWDDWKRDGGKWIPHPATWLNGGCWDDEISAPVSRYRDLSEELGR